VEQGARPHGTEEFLATLMSNPELVRNVAVVGHLHHGKTSVMDMFVEQTHDIRHEWRSNERQMKFTDTRYDEQVSTRLGAASPTAILVPTLSGVANTGVSCVQQLVLCSWQAHCCHM
jgi:U5 small nuclear ribonucleoprotein component